MSENPFNDSIDTRLTNLAAEHFGVDKAETRDFSREAAALFDPTEEVLRLRAINAGLARGHNGLLVALARTEEDAQARIEQAEAREEAATIRGNAVDLVTSALARIEDARDSDASAAASADLAEAVSFLTAALDITRLQSATRSDR